MISTSASRRHVRERLLHRAQVAHAVVDDRDALGHGIGGAAAAGCLEGSLGRRDHAGGARIGLHRHAQRARERLEHGLALVVRVVAAQVVDVQRHQRVVDEALEELVREVDVELADARARERRR